MVGTQHCGRKEVDDLDQSSHKKEIFLIIDSGIGKEQKSQNGTAADSEIMKGGILTNRLGHTPTSQSSLVVMAQELMLDRGKNAIAARDGNQANVHHQKGDSQSVE